MAMSVVFVASYYKQDKEKVMYTIREARISEDIIEYQVTDGETSYSYFYSREEAQECVDNLNNKSIITPEQLRELGL